MSMGRAQDILRSAVHELVELRSESRNYVCTKCKQSYSKPENVLDPSCPTCESLLRPEVVIMRAALEDRIAVLSAKISRLEDSLMAVLDLTG
jgi:NAD-dependent SIR2 family protein deacetylase